jgi:hypothetical protein
LAECLFFSFNACEVILEPQIMFEIKALPDSKAASRRRRDEQHIWNRLATQISDISPPEAGKMGLARLRRVIKPLQARKEGYNGCQSFN